MYTYLYFYNMMIDVIWSIMWNVTLLTYKIRVGFNISNRYLDAITNPTRTIHALGGKWIQNDKEIKSHDE